MSKCRSFCLLQAGFVGKISHRDVKQAEWTFVTVCSKFLHGKRTIYHYRSGKIGVVCNLQGRFGCVIFSLRVHLAAVRHVGFECANFLLRNEIYFCFVPVEVIGHGCDLPPDCFLVNVGAGNEAYPSDQLLRLCLTVEKSLGSVVVRHGKLYAVQYAADCPKRVSVSHGLTFAPGCGNSANRRKYAADKGQYPRVPTDARKGNGVRFCLLQQTHVVVRFRVVVEAIDGVEVCETADIFAKVGVTAECKQTHVYVRCLCCIVEICLQRIVDFSSRKNAYKSHVVTLSDLLFKAFAKVAVTCDCNVYQLKISLNGFVLTQLNAIEKNRYYAWQTSRNNDVIHPH